MFAPQSIAGLARLPFGGSLTMMLRLILSLQSAGSAGIPADFDLRKLTPAPAGDAIVVTARRQSQRIETGEPQNMEPPLGRAEIGLFGKVKGNLQVQSQTFGNGTTSQRVMVGIKLPF